MYCYCTQTRAVAGKKVYQVEACNMILCLHPLRQLNSINHARDQPRPGSFLRVEERAWERGCDPCGLQDKNPMPMLMSLLNN